MYIKKSYDELVEKSHDEEIKNGCYDALIVKGYWLDKIFDDKNPKDWEIRGNRTNKRGRIFLIQSGTGMIIGETHLINCLELDSVDFIANETHHKIKREICHGMLPYPNTYAWVFSNSIRYKEPIPYTHPQGAVIWVKIPFHLIKENR